MITGADYWLLCAASLFSPFAFTCPGVRSDRSDLATATLRKFFLSTVAEGRRFYSAAPIAAKPEKTLPPADAAGDDSSDD